MEEPGYFQFATAITSNDLEEIQWLEMIMQEYEREQSLLQEEAGPKKQRTYIPVNVKLLKHVYWQTILVTNQNMRMITLGVAIV